MSSFPVAIKAEPDHQNKAQTPAKETGGNDFIELTVALAITFFSVYYTSLMANRLIFLVFLIIAYRSKKDYLWLVWFFIVIDAPGRLFSAEAGDDLRIPIYSLGAGKSFLFQDIFILAYLAKFYFSSEKLRFVFKREFLYFYFTMSVFLLYSLALGMSLKIIILTAQYVIPWAWVILIPFFINGPEKMYKTCRLLFPFVFLALAAQIYTFIFGNFPDVHLRGLNYGTGFIVEEGGLVSRASSASYILVFTFIQSLLYLTSKKKLFKSSNYLAAVAFAAILQVFLSATRGWTLSFSFVLIGALLLMTQGGKIFRLFNLAVAAIIVFSILQWFFPPIRYQIKASSERISTMLLLAEGDVSAGGTLSRIDVRGKRVLNEFYKSPIFGWGFSNTYYKHADGHVGQQNILLNIGTVGFLYLNFLYLYLCMRTWFFSRSPTLRTEWGKGILVHFYGLLGLFIIHGSSSQFWGYIMHFDQTEKIFTISLLLAAINGLFLSSAESQKEEREVSPEPTKARAYL